MFNHGGETAGTDDAGVDECLPHIMVGDDVAETGIKSLKAINATKRRMERRICPWAESSDSAVSL